MKRLVTAALLCVAFVIEVAAQTIAVNPTGVNVNSQNPSVIFLTFGRLGSYRPAEAVWCGELVPAAPDLGFKCRPGTIYGGLPDRYDNSRLSGSDGYTDIMSIPPSIVRRAYQAAVRGADAGFFYVRRFVNTAGGPDQFVTVTCRMTGGGAGTPLALTDVRIRFAGTDKPVLFVKAGEPPPAVEAEIKYNGTGRLKGRWEVVMPGEELPDERDLLTEATLPVEERPRQRRYTQLSRFNVFLAPNGKTTLPGPDPSLLPTTLTGQYRLLLRVEASDDKEGDSNLAAVGVGAGVVHSGAVAGFPLPMLNYFVGGARDAAEAATAISLLLPADNSRLTPTRPIDFSWSGVEGAKLYRLEVTDGQGKSLLSALLTPGATSYRGPSWLGGMATAGELRWRVTALDPRGSMIGESPWRSLRLEH